MKRKLLIVSIVVSIFIIIGIGYAYSFTVPKITKKNETKTAIKSKKLELIFEDKNNLNFKALVPGTKVSKKFDVTSNASEKITYNLKIKSITNTYDSDVVFSIFKDGIKVSDNSPLPKTSKEEYIYTNIDINANEKHSYEVVFEYLIYEDELQSFNSGALFNGTFEIDFEKNVNSLLLVNDSKKIDNNNLIQKFYIKNISSNAINDYNLILNDVDTISNNSALFLKKNRNLIIDNMNDFNYLSACYLEQNVSINPGSINYYELNLSNIGDDFSANILINNTLDKNGPDVEFVNNGNDNYQKEHSTIVNLNDSNSDIKIAKYVWTQSEDTPDFSTATIFNSGAEITKNTDSGSWYLWIYAKDSIGNVTITKSNLFNLDNEAPICTISGNPTAWSTSATLVATATDNVSTIESQSRAVTSNGIQNFSVTDSAGNVGECSVNVTKVDNIKPTVSVKAGAVEISNGSAVYSATFGASGGKTICVNTSRSNASVSTYKSINALGVNNIKCTATSNAGLSASASGNITVNWSTIPLANLSVTSPGTKTSTQINLPKGAVQYGPYVQINKGCYMVWYFGTYLYASGAALYSASQNSPGIAYTLYQQNYIHENANYRVYVPANTTGSGIEFKTYNTNASLTVTITRISVTYQGTSC